MERMEWWKFFFLIYQWMRYLQVRIVFVDLCEEKYMLKYVFFVCLIYNLLCIYMVIFSQMININELI